MNPANVADAYALTPVQEGMLFHARLDPAAGVYVVQLWTPLLGPLDAAALHEAWRWAVARHPSLRTGFVSAGLPRPMQVVHREAALPWTELDWRGLSEDELEARKAAFLADDLARGFDLAAPPLIRLALARVADDEHLLFWTLHHLVLDGWSHTRVLREVLARYEALRTGVEHDPAAPRPYRDFVGWLQGQDAAPAEAFWRAALEGVREPTPLDVDTAAGAEAGTGAHERVLAPALADALRERARTLRVTLATLYQGAWALVLSRYAGVDDVVFGAVSAGRPESLPGAEAMVGMFVNTLPVRAPVEPESAVGPWLAALQARQAEARGHEHVGLVEVQGWTEVPRGRPLFESILAFENFPRVEGAGPGTGGLTVGQLGGVSRTGYPLTLVVHPGEETLLKAYHDRARIADAAAGRLLGHLEAALEGIAHAAPETRLGQIEIVPAAERDRLLAWGTNLPAEDPASSIVARFEAQAARTPDAVAAEYPDASLTYAALDAKANRIARRLAALGVSPGDRVGVVAAASADTIAALAGVLKAGAAVVPLDPGYPAERLAFMAADTEARALVTRDGALAGVAAGIAVLDLARDAAAVDAEDAAPLGIAVDPASAAYVLYTSGSTGTPKGVVVPHGGVVRTVVGSDHVRFGPATRVAQQANFSFDVAMWEVWGALLNGGAIVDVAREEMLSSDYGRVVRERRITTAFATVQLFNRHVRETPDVFAAMEDVLVGGEALDAAAIRACLAGGPPRRLLNAYGPTECSVYSAWHRVTDVAPGATSVPIGRPLAHTRLYVVDARGQLAPLGVAGELCVGGGRVASGYLNRPELTAERFVPDPFAGDPAARMYRTGDRARWTDGGVLEYLGRLDGQVKVRGFRIEPGEVEAALRAHPAVADTVVVAREDAPGDRRLVAYVVARDGARADAAELRAQLARRLPEYMVPSAFVALGALPLNRNGKVDRAALPAPEAAADETAGAAPRDETEELLAALFAEVLGVERIGVRDSFFDAGGHSLKAMQLGTRVRESLRMELPLLALFEDPTVAGAAEWLRARAAGAGRLERTARFARLVRAMDDAEVRARLDDAAGGAKGRTEAARRRELLDHFLRQDGLAAAGEGGIVPRGYGGPAPLSFPQERLWVADQLTGGGATYVVPTGIRIRGALDAGALARAVAEIVRRHDALRTTFAEADDEPVQVVHPYSGFDLPVIDLTAVSPGERDAALDAWAEEEAAHPFDLAAGPLFRARLVRLADDDHALLVSLHHVVADGWSLAVLFRELDALYAAFRRGEPSPLAPLPVQYADFAAWQRAHASDERMERAVEWWRGRLGGLPEVLELPADRPRPAVASHAGAVLSIRLPAALAESLRELSRGEGATTFMALLAGLDALLHRWTGATDFAVGTPVAGRTSPEVEGLIGFFVNTLVLRADLSDDPSFRALLRRARETTLDAYAHQDVPFERLVNALRPERSLGHEPFFQVALALQNAGELRPRLDGVEAGRMRVASAGARADLTFSLVEADGAIEGIVEYATDLFDRATVERMAAHLRVLLAAAVADPDAPVSSLSILPEDERRTLLEEWSGRERPYPRETIDRLFAARASQEPDAVALVDGEETIAYAELDARANRLARRLRALGVAAGTRVGLCLERSAASVTATLAILKAGGAYVPLDPAYPEERLAFMLEDTAVPVVVTDSRLAPALPAHRAATVLVDRDADAIAAESSEPLDAGTTPESAAYVMYTSGSTGRPKGTLVAHRGVVRLVRETDVVEVRPGDAFLHMASPSFDAATLEVWAPLLNGGRLVVHAESKPTVDGVARAVAEHGLTVLWLSAGLFHLMVDERPEALRGVRHLTAGGDVVSADHVRRVLAAFPGVRVTNGYGPTENTTFTCCHHADAPPPEGVNLPIGRPVASTRVYVLDARMAPVPIGVAGELYAGGAGLALGYLNRPELTAEKFVPDPFSPDPAARLYRTGDRVRWRADGSVEFLGRADTQVKVRGFRVEPGEVEAALRAHPRVRDAVVTVREDAPGDRRLVAHAATDAGAAALRAFLAERLPDYMVPSAVVAMDALPLTANGKVDRRALPAPEWAGEPDGYVPPRTATEEALAGLWSEVLHVARVGAHDDFFALGGHSLLATRVLSRVRRVFEVELGVRVLFEAPTLARLAPKVDEARGAETLAAAPPVRPVPRGGALPLSFAQQRLWFLDRLEPGSTRYNVPVALRLSGPLDVAALEKAVDRVVRRHEALRTTFAAVEADAVQVIAPPSAFTLAVEPIEDADDGEAEALRRARAEADAPFDLARGPLFRARLLRMGAEEHVLLMTTHHTVADGWSIGLLFRELSALYAAFAEGRPSPLAPLPVQYADFAAWQRGVLGDHVLDAQLEWWRAALAGAPALLELPTDHPRPSAPAHRGATARARLPRETAAALRTLGRREGVTLFMSLLAAYQALLGRCAGQDEVVVGSAIAGRTRGETEGVVGDFVNMLALRADLSGDPTFRELLRRVRETTLGAYAHQDLPFERLVEALHPERSLQHSPVFQAYFVLHGAYFDVPDFPGLRVARVVVEETQAKFDLSLSATEGHDGIGLALHYDRDLFEPATARRLLGQLVRLLAAAAADPGRPLSALTTVTEEERARIAAWEAGPPLADSIAPWPAQVAARVREAPEAVALVHSGDVVTYAEMDARANRLARHLRRLGVGPESRVGLCLARTPELVVSLLGILRAGAAAVPLEPHFPPARIASVLADAGAGWVVGTAATLEPVAIPEACRPIRLDEAATKTAVDSESPEDPKVELHPDSVWAVFYTSGSTGKPKGVMVRHASLASFAAWMRERFPLETGERVLAATSVCFDVHVAEVHHALAAGGTLVIVENALSLAELPADAGFAQAAMVPTAARELLSLGRFPAGVRRVLLAGEPLPDDLARALFGAGVREVHNLYGPTEDTTYSTHSPLAPGERVTIGRPFHGRRVYVLDGRLERVPVGVVGEIYLAGCGLARGYLGRPGLTAERFVPDPHGPPGSRMYASGDRGRWLDTGELGFAGRADFQVKLRGFRVEPGEVENVLREHPAVRDAVVAARGSDAARRLVAWVAAAEGEHPDPVDLAAWVKGRLPAYMVPAAVVVMDALPRTATDKVDRNALPEPVLEAEERPYLPPRTATEAGIAEVWAEVLGVERVGADDDFFALGGHSLGAMHAWAKLRERFGVELPLRALFEHPALEALARAVDAAAPVEPEAAESPVTARSRSVRAVRIAPAAAESAGVSEGGDD
ncbi:MAG TPA: amino acid adenylation domain-containing protein [Longimicrobium sp.]|nr:amino acid adenylation domain-containing protein [Longimicrobium sp.]